MLLPSWRAAILKGEFEDALYEQGSEWKQARGRLYARVCLMKSYLIRNGVAMEPYLSEDHPEPAYHCGRLLAVLADLQRAALGDVGANVVQRYYARASTAPADALGPLIRLSNAHLNKIADRGLAEFLQGRIADIWGKLRVEQPPATLDAIGQSLFAMGFYQQIARMRHDRSANAARKREQASGADSSSTDNES
jgi:CRISPR-associated protein Csd1